MKGHKETGEELVRQDIITREELEQAREEEKRSGTPWYKQFIRSGKITFSTLEDILWYEYHSKSRREEHNSLGDDLLERKILTKEELNEALQEQKHSGRLLGNILVDRGYVSREELGKSLARQYGMDFAPVSDTPSTVEALEAVSESIALKNELIPVMLEGDRLVTLVTAPQTRERLDNVGIMLGKRLYPLLTACDDVHAEIKKRYRALEDAGESKGAGGKKKAITSEAEVVRTNQPLRYKGHVAQENQAAAMDENSYADTDAARFEDVAREASGASVIKMVATILEGAVNASATDIHLDPQEPEMRVRYRIDGVLHDVMSIPPEIEAAAVSRVKILAELDITETRHPQDGHISLDIGEREFDLRVATLPTFLGERVVLRLLDQSSVLSGIRDLGLEAEDEEKLTELIEEPYGMILVTGPTGSGKTTTLYAALNQKNVMTDSIVTLEDPVEYQLSGINQVQVDPDIGLTFASTLRAALRQDIDVLLVGEIRDVETAHIAIRAAMTGHLVFSTLHTNDAPEAIATLRNMGVPAYLISSALTAVVAQRLVRTICPDCKKSEKPASGLLQTLGLPESTKKFYRGAGCHACYRTGNRGRTGIFELLEVTPEVRTLIEQEATAEDIAKAANMKTMADRCRAKITAGLVEPEEFIRVIRT